MITNFHSPFFIFRPAIFCCILLLFACRTKQQVEYNIPSHYTPEAREMAIESFEKGKALYKVNCSSCHGIYQKGKETVPNFTTTQIDNYNAMFIKGDPKNHSVATKLSQEQLNYILTFLRLRKRNN
ncbi:MAG TPA: c-type cytochrome [Puia sp.]|nr:c-type cytochrome [Puia sp.]